MTIQLLHAWNGYGPNVYSSMGANEEARLVAAGLARYWEPALDRLSSDDALARNRNSVIFYGDSHQQKGQAIDQTATLKYEYFYADCFRGGCRLCLAAASISWGGAQSVARPRPKFWVGLTS